MNARTRIALCLLLLLAFPAVAEMGRYRIMLGVLPGDDPAMVARQIVAVTRGRLEPYAEEGGNAFVVVASETAMRTVAHHPAIVRIERLPALSVPAPANPQAAAASASPRPGVIGPDATSATWTTGTYDYDGAGNVKSITRSDFTERFVYDAFGRLTSGTVASGRSEARTYDAFGNTLTRTLDATTVSFGVSPATNRMDVPGYSMTATYDNAGRITGSTTQSFTYDPFDAVTESTVDGVWKVHLYSASDERVASVTVVNNAPAVWNWTIRDNSGRVLRRFTKPSGGTLMWREDYIYRDSQMLAAEVDAPEKRRHFHPDHLGTPRLITGNGGVRLGLHNYYPFGAEISAAQEGEEKTFTGHERDAPTLDYMHARYYAPGWGRFLSVDPVLDLKRAIPEPQLWNRYSYVTNNPLKYTDPDGRERLLSRSALPSQANFEANVASTMQFLRDAIHYDDVREAFSGFGSAPMNEKLMGGAVGLIAGLDIGSNFLAPEGRGAVATGEAIGFRSFRAFKAMFGSAGAKAEWHHVVEQTAGNTARFGAGAIHNTVNVVRLDQTTHRAISGYYSSKQAFTGGKTVREWLSTKSYKKQYEFGQRMVKIFSSIPK